MAIKPINGVLLCQINSKTIFSVSEFQTKIRTQNPKPKSETKIRNQDPKPKSLISIITLTEL